jgi:alpha-L-fucosidase
VLIKSLAPKPPVWAGLYPNEISSVTMLGDGRELKWEMTREGMRIQTPDTKPGDYAFVFKIVRRRPF